MTNKLDKLWASRFSLSDTEVASLLEVTSEIMKEVPWYKEARLNQATRDLFLSTFIHAIQDPGYLKPTDLDDSDHVTASQLIKLFSDFIFSQLWEKRDILSPGEGDLLYTLLVPVLKKSTELWRSVPKDQHMDLIHEFVLYKFLTPVTAGHDDTPSWDNVSRPWHLLGWMNRYVTDHLRKQSRRPVAIANKTTINKDSEGDALFPTEFIDLNNPESELLATQEVLEKYWTPDFLTGAKYLGEKDELAKVTDVLCEYELSPEQVLNECSSFLGHSEDWIQLLLSNAAARDSIALSKFGSFHKISSVHYKAARLGIINKRTYPAGSENSYEYHKNTILGQWMIEAFGVSAPLRPDFIETIFKILCMISLKDKDS